MTEDEHLQTLVGVLVRKLHEPGSLSFDEAIARANADEGAAWGFAFQAREGAVTGGEIYVISTAEDADESTPERWVIWLSGGEFFSSEGTDDVIMPGDPVENLKSLRFLPLPHPDLVEAGVSPDVVLEALLDPLG
jgi:hypothetical protein